MSNSVDVKNHLRRTLYWKRKGYFQWWEMMTKQDHHPQRSWKHCELQLNKLFATEALTSTFILSTDHRLLFYQYCPTTTTTTTRKRTIVNKKKKEKKISALEVPTPPTKRE
jgi:hypothetical protein